MNRDPAAIFPTIDHGSFTIKGRSNAAFVLLWITHLDGFWLLNPFCFYKFPAASNSTAYLVLLASINTTNPFTAPFSAGKEPPVSLHLLNDKTLGGNQTIFATTKEDTFNLLLPVVGGLISRNEKKLILPDSHEYLKRKNCISIQPPKPVQRLFLADTVLPKQL